MRKLLIPSYGLIVLLTFATKLSASVPTSYSFGIVPQQSAKKLAQAWTPVLQYLSTKTGIKLQFKTAKNIPEFEKRLADGDYDFSYM
ncbi:MAG: PhnD/SsuA/transferrin family substrate-binding protein, partial [Pseudomonadota bacterium]